MDFKQFGSQGHKPGTCHTKAVLAIQVRTVAVLVVIPVLYTCRTGLHTFNSSSVLYLI